MKGKDMKKRQKMHWEAYYDFYREFFTSASQIPIQPPTHHTNSVAPSNVVLSQEIRPVVQKISNYIYGHLLGIEVPPKEGSLVSLCLERLDVEKILYVGYKGQPTAVYTTNDISLSRQLRILSDFCSDTTLRGTGFQALRTLVSPALRMLEQMLGVKQYEGKLDFLYSPKAFLDYVRLGVSGGILSANTTVFEDDGMKYKVKDSGKKIFLFEPSARAAHKIIIQLLLGEEPDYLHLDITKIKGEWRYGFLKLLDDLVELTVKAREFFIPSLALSLISELLHGFRMNIERGNVIRIGSTAWYGGWYELALFLHCYSDELIWVDGDVTALDKHIQDWHLYLYLAAGSRYYNFKKMNARQRQFMKRLYTYVMYNVVNKVTLQVGNFWRIICGVMYSGGKETSHGDSWIMGFLFCLYICFVIESYPRLSSYIMLFVDRGFIRFVLYGDDHIWCFPKVFRGIFSAKGFADFLLHYVDMELRDYREYESFFSIPDFATGTVKVEGPKFLKRYFIKNTFLDGCAPVLAYKPFLETVVRLMTVDDTDGYLGLVLKTMGQAYDTMGTNVVAYEACAEAYRLACESGCLKLPREMYLEYTKTHDGVLKMKKMLRRINLSPEEVFAGFPALYQLQKKNIHDPERCNFSKVHNYDEWLDEFSYRMSA